MALIETFEPSLSNIPESYSVLTFKVDMFDSLNAVFTK